MELIRRRRAFFIVIAIAFLLRVLWSLLVPIDPVSDSAMYDTFARRIAAGHGYSYPDGTFTAYWPVGPSALYGFIYWLFGPSYLGVLGLNVCLGTALVAAVYLLAEREWNTRAAVCAGAIAACWPLLIQFTTVFSSELPFMLLTTLALLAWKGSGSGVRRTAATAVLLVAAAFMRPTALPLLLVLPLAGLVQHRKVPLAFRQVAVFLIVASLLIAPWALRNQRLFGQPVLVSTNFGVNLWMGNNPATDGGYMPLPDRAELAGKSEVERDAMLEKEAKAFIASNPLRYLRLCIQRIFTSFGRETIGVAWNGTSLPEPSKLPLKAVSTAYWLAMLAFAIVGVGFFLRTSASRVLHPFVITPALLASSGILIVGQDRYHMPVIPFVALFAGALLSLRLHRTPAGDPDSCQRRKPEAPGPRGAEGASMPSSISTSSGA
jgi:4-amino-4-deoxy-L-arabinose transferase-like glycosyltransferase